MGPVERAIRGRVRPGLALATPGQGKPFVIEDISNEGVVLLLGKGQWRTPIPWRALEGVPGILRGRGWVRTTGSFAPEDDASTLSGHLKQFVNRETAIWVVVVLERAGVLEIDRTRPIRARLRDDFPS